MNHAPVLDDVARRALLAIAEDAISRVLATGDMHPHREATPTERDVLHQVGATFVTLLRGKELLGCVGSLRAVEPLADAVSRAAVQAAFADPRMPAVTWDDFAAMTIKVSVLSDLEDVRVKSFDELAQAVQPARDGLVVDAGHHRATLLPSVWEQCPETDAFLSALWEKAGLLPRAWPRGINVSRYITEEFSSEPDAERQERIARGAS